MLENIDFALVDWSRAQFALTAMFHWIFVPLTLGLGFMLALWNLFMLKPVTRSGKNSPNSG